MAGRDGWSAELDDKAPAGQRATAGQDATVRTQATRQLGWLRLMAAALQGDDQPLDRRLGRATTGSKERQLADGQGATDGKTRRSMRRPHDGNRAGKTDDGGAAGDTNGGGIAGQDGGADRATTRRLIERLAGRRLADGQGATNGKTRRSRRSLRDGHRAGVADDGGAAGDTNGGGVAEQDGGA